VGVVKVFLAGFLNGFLAGFLNVFLAEILNGFLAEFPGAYPVDFPRAFPVELSLRNVLTSFLLFVIFSIDERSFVPPTEHGRNGPFHRGFAAVELALIGNDVLLPALSRVQSELLPSRQRVFHLRA
jgi:hypothetical protein